MIRSKRHLAAFVMVLLVWAPCAHLFAQGSSTQGNAEARAGIKQKLTALHAEGRVIVHKKELGPPRLEGGISVREGSMTLSLRGRPSRTIRIKIRQKMTKSSVENTEQSITALDESTHQESTWSLADEAGAVTFTLNGSEKLKTTANPDGSLSVNGAVYPDETTASTAARQVLAASNLVPECAQAVAETAETLLEDSVTTSRGLPVYSRLLVFSLNVLFYFIEQETS